jgi:hypothetical protein
VDNGILLKSTALGQTNQQYEFSGDLLKNRGKKSLNPTFYPQKEASKRKTAAALFPFKPTGENDWVAVPRRTQTCTTPPAGR